MGALVQPEPAVFHVGAALEDERGPQWSTSALARKLDLGVVGQRAGTCFSGTPVPALTAAPLHQRLWRAPGLVVEKAVVT